MKVIYGYCRISTKKQKMERQRENIKALYPDAIIIEETFTGTTTDRPKFDKLMSKVRKDAEQGNDITLVFDEVSRMSRNAKEGFEIYKELYEKGVNLVFLKERYIDTDNFKKTLQSKVGMTGTDVDIILSAVNEYLMKLAEKQIQIAFEQAQAEVDNLHKRTSEGVQRAIERYKRETLLGLQHEKDMVGRKKDSKAGIDFKETEKAKQVKELIKKYSKTFNGTLPDKECMKVTGISHNTFYKYKKEIKHCWIITEGSVKDGV